MVAAVGIAAIRCLRAEARCQGPGLLPRGEGTADRAQPVGLEAITPRVR
jgi:hypothetical protein